MQITTQRGAFLTIFFLSLCSLQDNHHSSSAVYCREGGSGLPWWSPAQWLHAVCCVSVMVMSLMAGFRCKCTSSYSCAYREYNVPWARVMFSMSLSYLGSALHCGSIVPEVYKSNVPCSLFCHCISACSESCWVRFTSVL